MGTGTTNDSCCDSARSGSDSTTCHDHQSPASASSEDDQQSQEEEDQTEERAEHEDDQNAPSEDASGEDAPSEGASGEDNKQTEEPEDPTALTRPNNLDFSSLGTSCVRIARTQDRGISVKQLRRVRDFIKHFANEHGELLWMDLAPAEFNVGRLCTQKINLYQVPRITSCFDLMCDMPGGWLDHKACDRALPVQSDRASS